MKKRAVCILLCIVICFTLTPTAALAAARDTSFEDGLARDLKSLGLFRGVSDTDFALGRAPTRIEALVMLIRILGKEDEALSRTWRHPFTDVPSWADRYVGFAYQTGLTNGTSPTTFGDGNADAAMYLTFVLRALGYSDAGGNFAWNDPFSLAIAVGILPNFVNVNSFLRADVVTVSYAALSSPIKGSRQALYEKLVAAGVFTRQQFYKIYNTDAITDRAVSYPGETDADTVIVHYEWDYLNRTWTYDIPISTEAVNWFKSIKRDPLSYYTGYSSYVTETLDDEFFDTLANKFMAAATVKGFSKDYAAGLAISFVQSLTYIPDDEELGFDYPKYPLETLYDKGGDCEDTSILLVSLLRGMGYGCCLVVFDDHMGVGILGRDTLSGRYFEKNGNKYFYVETTAKGWNVGMMPEDLIPRTAAVWEF